MIFAKLLLISLITITLVDAGFRCSIGEWACKLSCKSQLKKTGICDDDGECTCSALPMTLDSFIDDLPSRCDIGPQFCTSTCHAIGRKDGTCSSDGCDCSDEKLKPTELALCSAESTCRIYCQAKGKATGDCDGWNCVCSSADLEKF